MENARPAEFLGHLHVIVSGYAPLIAVAVAGLILAIVAFVVLPLVVAVQLARRNTHVSRVRERAFPTHGSAARVHQAA